MSREIRVRQGGGEVRLSLPATAKLSEFGIRQDLPAAPDLSAALRRALQPLRSGEFQRAAAGRHLALLVDDATRSEPHLAELAACLELCSAVRPATVTVFVCTGTHDGRQAENVALLRDLTAAA